MIHPDRSSVGQWLSIAGATAVILLQIIWPLAGATGRIQLTQLIVVVFAATSVIHAATFRGGRWTAMFVVWTFTFSLLLEAVGVRLGIPFGDYQYTELLGPRLLGVPVIVPLAWLMMSYPAFVVSRRIAIALPIRSTVISGTAIGAIALTSWDVFLDPQMVGEGYWIWQPPFAELPGISGIPATNYLGWLISSAILMLVIHALPSADPTRQMSEVVPATLWVWTWIGGIIANVFFLDRPAVGVVGGLAMAIVTVPYLAIVWRDR